jgi:hypothetical protein
LRDLTPVPPLWPHPPSRGSRVCRAAGERTRWSRSRFRSNTVDSILERRASATLGRNRRGRRCKAPEIDFRLCKHGRLHDASAAPRSRSAAQQRSSPPTKQSVSETYPNPSRSYIAAFRSGHTELAERGRFSLRAPSPGSSPDAAGSSP